MFRSGLSTQIRYHVFVSFLVISKFFCFVVVVLTERKNMNLMNTKIRNDLEEIEVRGNYNKNYIV